MHSLAIISHTPHFYNKNGKVVGLEPTIREINYLSQVFDTIFHIAPLYTIDPHNATLAYVSNNIIFIPIKPTGGKNIFSKLDILFYIPYNLYKIIVTIVKVQWVHLRVPTNLGLFVLPLLSVLKNKKKWVKYAGNWTQTSIPLSYRLQRWWLRNNLQNSKVTINGSINRQKLHLVPFLNPCLSKKEINMNRELGSSKNFNGMLTFCFVGRIEKLKGWMVLLEAINNLDKINWIDKLHFVGEIIENNYIEKLNSNGKIAVEYHGILDRTGLNKIYEVSHFIILPSETEGFPKVLIEASSFGCIPIVPPIPSILIHINQKKQNGIELEDISPKSIEMTIKNLNEMRNELSVFSKNAMENAREFSYEKYNHRILNEIIQN